MSITQRQLAARLGLSYATVSRVFNGDLRVREPTRDRVLREAERLGFHRHALARGLRLRRTFAIGMVGSTSPDSYWSDLLAGLERRARAGGYHVIPCHRRDPDAGSSDEIRFLLDRPVDALVLSPHPRREDPLLLEELAGQERPLLLVNSLLPGFSGHYLGTDSRSGSREACRYLLGLGHRRIAFLAGPQGEYTAECRLQGFRDALREAGVPEARCPVLRAGWRQEDGEDAAARLLAHSPRPTAVQAVSDRVAIGCCRGLQSRGVHVPRDLSLVGYSGDRAGEVLASPLTTVVQPAERLGERAAEVILELLERLNGLEEGRARPVREELPDRLLIRASCAPPRERSAHAVA